MRMTIFILFWYILCRNVMTAGLSSATFGSTGVDVWPLQRILTEQSCSQTAIFMHLQKKILSLEAQKLHKKPIYYFLHSNLEPWNCWLLPVTNKAAIGRQFSSNETCLKAVEVKLKVRLHLGLSVPIMSQAILLDSSKNIPKISMLTWMII